MRPGDLARLKDVGIRSGEIVTIVRVHPPRPLPNVFGSWTCVDYLHDGELVEECDSSFLEVIECE
jgi:hypothetical protein